MIESTINRPAKPVSKNLSGEQKKNLGKAGLTFYKLVVTVVLALIIIVIAKSQWDILAESKVQKFPADVWQAIFLDNGQVYFGHVQKVTSKTIVLNDIYYLQVINQPLQRSQEGGETPSQPEQRLTLIKLGNEIHGPVDTMNISRDHVIIMENLKNDSRVVQAITKYVDDQSKQP